MPIIRSWALTRGFTLHPETRKRYEIRYTRTQHRPPSRQVNDHGRVSGTHTTHPEYRTKRSSSSAMTPWLPRSRRLTGRSTTRPTAPTRRWTVQPSRTTAACWRKPSTPTTKQSWTRRQRTPARPTRSRRGPPGLESTRPGWGTVSALTETQVSEEIQPHQMMPNSITLMLYSITERR